MMNNGCLHIRLRRFRTDVCDPYLLEQSSIFNLCYISSRASASPKPKSIAHWSSRPLPHYACCPPMDSIHPGFGWYLPSCSRSSHFTFSRLLLHETLAQALSLRDLRSTSRFESIVELCLTGVHVFSFGVCLPWACFGKLIQILMSANFLRNYRM